MPGNCSKNAHIPLDLQCWRGIESISRQNAYRLYLAAVLVCIGSFAFFNVQKTKYLQMLTSFLRWTGKFKSIRTKLFNSASIEDDMINVKIHKLIHKYFI